MARILRGDVVYPEFEEMRSESMELSSAQNPVVGTAIVAVRTPNEVVVAADSKATYAGTTQTESHCKINQEGNIFFTSAKLVGDDKNKFSAANIARQAIRQGGTLRDILIRFEKMVAVPLYNFSFSIKENNLDLYYQISGGESVLDVVFCGIENNSPLLMYRTFMPAFPPDEPSLQGERGEIRNDDKPAFICLGHTRPLGPFLQTHPDYLRRVGLVNAVRNLIQIAIDDDPKFVGPPITILRVDRRRATWIQKSPACPPIKKYW